MRTKSVVVGAVVAAHCIVVCAVLLMQGCRTPVGPAAVAEPEQPVMPPLIDTVETAPVREVSAPAPVQSEARSWPEQTGTYIVAAGDTLSVVASRFGMSVADLVALNNISDPNKIRAGTPLIVTGTAVQEKPRPVVKETPKAPKPAKASEGAVTYEVKSGDSLSKIAAKHGVKTADLKQANGLTSDRILVGWKLVIPGAKRDKAAPSATPEAQVESPAPAASVTDPAAQKPPAVPAAGGAGAEAAAVTPPLAGAAPVAAEGVRIHVVEEGEDLYAIAMMWGVSATRIREMNSLKDATVNPGDRLKIPVAE